VNEEARGDAPLAGESAKRARMVASGPGDPPQAPIPVGRRPDVVTLTAFGIVVLLVAANPLAVRYTDRTLAPFWGAGTRIAAGALLFTLYVAIRRISLPRGRDLGGVVLYGVIQFGVGFGLGYWALQKVPAGIAGVILAAVPLFTLVFAVITRLEPLTARGVLGALISIAGVALILGLRGGEESVPLLYLAAMIVFVACLAGGLVIAKTFSSVHPAVMNAGGMLVGGVLLLGLSFVLGEPKPLPRMSITWAVQLYVVVVGSVGLFALILFVVRRWTASAAAYQTVLSPPFTILLAALLLGEPVGWSLVVGAVVVILGVYVGALSPRHCREALECPPPPRFQR
jgi:drug/metabolite transporter (DMT)-like permease